MPTPTWNRLPAAKRDAVLAAAEAEFGERGFSGASLNTICRKAEISKGSLFQYFTDKADMYAHLAELASLRIRAAMEAEVARLPVRDVPPVSFGVYYKTLQGDPPLKTLVGLLRRHTGAKPE